MSASEAPSQPGRLLVVGPRRFLQRAAIRAELETVSAKPIPVSLNSESSIVELKQRLSTSIPDWTIALFDDGNPVRFTAAVPTLLESGVDDVIDPAHDDFVESFRSALKFGSDLIAGIRRVQDTGLLIGNSKAAARIRKAAALAIQASDLPVLIEGETGTGKGQLARAIHSADAERSNHPLHILDCGGITETLFGSELFGHVRGAFTGAQQNRRGAFETAGPGVLLMDEVGELLSSTQSYLLSALQDRTYRPVGSDRSFPVECRIVAATNRCLETAVSDGRFRPDLFHRLNGFRLSVPPLRERPDDVPVLLRHFVGADRDNEPVELDTDVADYLTTYSFPGNIRELIAISGLMRARSGEGNRIRFTHIPFDRLRDRGNASSGHARPDTVEQMILAGMQMREIESAMTRRVAQTAIRIWCQRRPGLPRTEVVKVVASNLGVSPRTIYNKLNGADNPD